MFLSSGKNLISTDLIFGNLISAIFFWMFFFRIILILNMLVCRVITILLESPMYSYTKYAGMSHYTNTKFIVLNLLYLNNGKNTPCAIIGTKAQYCKFYEWESANVTKRCWTSRKYGQTVTKGVIYRITKNREKLSKPEKKENQKKKFREVPIRFPCFEEYVMEELRGVPTKKRKVVIK